MWLADTSIWIEHFRYGRTEMTERLTEGLVLMHPYISGELACGNLKNRSETLFDLATLSEVIVATHAEVLQLVEQSRLWGRGLGWIDAHLLASALLTRCRLWTLDKRLAQAAKDLGIS